jgi:hypothetical protein
MQAELEIRYLRTFSGLVSSKLPERSPQKPGCCAECVLETSSRFEEVRRLNREELLTCRSGGSSFAAQNGLGPGPGTSGVAR